MILSVQTSFPIYHVWHCNTGTWVVWSCTMHIVYLTCLNSEEPMTLLPSTACNVAVKASRHGIHDYQPIRDLIPLMKKVNTLLGKGRNDAQYSWKFLWFQWYPFDVIATAAWESIDNLLQSLQGTVTFTTFFLIWVIEQSILGPCKTWNQLSSSLSFKRLMSKKSLSVKKQLSSLNDQVGWTQQLLWYSVLTKG